MKAIDMIDALGKYPPNTEVMVYDYDSNSYLDPELKMMDVIAVSEWGRQRICKSSEIGHYNNYQEMKILALR